MYLNARPFYREVSCGLKEGLSSRFTMDSLSEKRVAIVLLESG